jgi:Rieske Fe-S protein
MPTCDQCGNDYDKVFKIILGNRTMTFDCFECAIQAMAPHCAHCGCAVIGHGVETDDGKIFCCAHCSRQEGIKDLKDRIAKRVAA